MNVARESTFAVESLQPAGFQIGVEDRTSSARQGWLQTSHGRVETPAFMPVATQGSVKGLTPAQVAETGAEIVLANTYHLCLRPGIDLVERMGGLHRFMGWPGAILTDSGGYQIMSLAPLRTVSDEGVAFRSHLDGSRLFLSPEDVVRVQGRMGVDVLMPLDECLPAGAERAAVEKALCRTTEWAVRSVREPVLPGRLLFGIVQGGFFPDLRERHAGQLAAFDFPGYAVGGLSVGEDRGVTQDVAAVSVAALPRNRPHYLMGVGLPQELLRFVAMGYDLFDCVLPTRNGRNGTCFTARGRVNIRLARHAQDDAPVDDECSCYSCRNFSRAYLRHLAVAGEMLGAQLASLHNVHFYQHLMRQARSHIRSGDFALWAEMQARRMEEGEAS
jgi:queuine tRNA-ribosyltransferase